MVAPETRMSCDPRRTAGCFEFVLFSDKPRRSSGCKWLEMEALLITRQLVTAWDNNLNNRFE
jgi:hypothetical protein